MPIREPQDDNGFGTGLRMSDCDWGLLLSHVHLYATVIRPS